jgi:hypothetical protein
MLAGAVSMLVCRACRDVRQCVRKGVIKGVWSGATGASS